MAMLGMALVVLTREKTGRLAVKDAIPIAPLSWIVACFVFTNKGKRIKNITLGFKNAAKRAGLEDFSFHDLRHTDVAVSRLSI